MSNYNFYLIDQFKKQKSKGNLKKKPVDNHKCIEIDHFWTFLPKRKLINEIKFVKAMPSNPEYTLINAKEIYDKPLYLLDFIE